MGKNFSDNSFEYLKSLEEDIYWKILNNLWQSSDHYMLYLFIHQNKNQLITCEVLENLS